MKTTAQPKTLEAYSKTWNTHKPGDDRPCDAAERVCVLMRGEETTRPADAALNASVEAGRLNWGESPAHPNHEIVAWRRPTAH